MQDSKLNQLTGYLSMGWALVPLHDVSSGACSCWAAGECRSAGKHPRLSQWHEESQLVRSAETLATLHLASPEWNWGLATGSPSGVWALDIDLQGMQAVQVLQAQHGGFGMTRQHRTGSGGWHLIFITPPDFEIHNSQTRNRFGLPPGIDVRGWHGQIVLPPSVSAKGAYSVMSAGAPARAPAWLETMLRTPVERPPDTPAAPRTTTDLPGVSEVPGGRGRAYARSAVEGSLAELRDAPVGTRNDTAYRVACRLIELANAPWSGVELAKVELDWWYYAEAHPDGARVPRAELDGVWRRAAARVGDTAAEPPSEAGWHLGGESVPLSGTSPVASSGPGGLVAGEVFAEPNGVARATITNGNGVVTGTPAGGAGVTAVDPVDALIGLMLTPEQLREMPAPEPLVNGVLDLDTCAWLIGAPGSYKSFVAYDLAVHIGRGEPWRGHPVRQGLAVYVAGEGARGLRLRQDAWEREYGPVKDVLVLPMPVGADERRGSNAWSVLVAAIARLRPALVVLDTQARMTVGLNENDNADMSYYAEQADRLKRASGACVLTVHHTGRSGSNARGASAIDGAQDAELRLERKGNLAVELHMDKQKDQAEELPMIITLRRSEGGTDPATGRDLSSLVLAPAGAADIFAEPEGPINKAMMRAIALYRLIYEGGNAGEGMTRAEIKAAFVALPIITDEIKAKASQDKAWRRAWNGDQEFMGLIGRRLISKRAGAERFKIIVVPNQGSEGALTPNVDTMPEAGWNIHGPNDEVE